MLRVWRLLLLHVVTCIVRLPSSAAASNITDILWMLGPRTEVDVVGVLDRSQGVGQHNFLYFVHPFFESLLGQYAALHADYARSAVVTFAGDATVDYDTISGGSDGAVSKCELFASPSLWHRVAFVNDRRVIGGTNISGALQHAITILDAGRANRPNVTQVEPPYFCQLYDALRHGYGLG